MTAIAIASDSGCPSREQLRELVIGHLEPASQAAIATHVETCDSCQATLKILTDGSQTKEWRQIVKDRQAFKDRVQGDAETASFHFLAKVKKSSPASDTVIEFPLPPTPEAPLGRLESYEVQRELGHGGMGVVFLARDAHLRHFVALKVLKPDLAVVPSERERFYREGRAVAAVKHDHVVAIHSAFAGESFLPYLVMEFVDGQPLDKILKTNGAFPPREAARLVQHAAQGLAAAHKKSIIHRDVKPSNMMLETATGRIKITDFGLARRPDLDDENLTRHGHIVGTPAYMSPEHVVHPDQVDESSDIYSLGVVLYELMTGEKPFTGKAHMVLHQIVKEEPRAPRRLNDAIPRDLETICLKCLRKTPADRYADAHALAADLDRLLAARPIFARPVGRREKIWMWCRRNPWIATPTAASVLLFLLAFTVVTWSAIALKYLNQDLHQQMAAKTIAQRETEAQRDVADERADGLLLTNETILNDIISRIGKTPGLLPLKQDLLRAAAKSLEGLPSMTGKSRLTTAASALRQELLQHRVHLEIGETDKAWTHISAAHNIARQRIIDQDNSTASRLNFGDVARDMARMRRQYDRDMQVVLTFAREAVRLYEDILANPKPALNDRQKLEIAQKLTGAHSLVATTLHHLDNPAQALAHYEKEQSIRDSLLSDAAYLRLPAATRQKNEPAFRRESAVTQAAIGEMNFRLGRPDQARTAYDKTLATLGDLHVQRPDDPTIKGKFAEMLDQAGNLKMLVGDRAKAAEHFDLAIQLGSQLAAADPTIVEHQRWLARAHFRRGILRQTQNDPTAKDDFDACLKIRAELAKDATNVDRQRELLLILPRCGKVHEADDLAKKLLAENPNPDVELLLDLARAYAQCSTHAGIDATTADAFRAKALAHLKQAVTAGHRDPVYLQHEPDFTPLRQTPDFQDLVKQEQQPVPSHQPDA